MKSRRLARFGILIFAGVLLVYVFGIDRDEGLLGRKAERIKSEDSGEFRPDHGPGTSVALTDAIIPVREVSDEYPGVQLRQYVIHVGRAQGTGSKRMPAENVRIDIYNKKPPPEERLTARIYGDNAVLEFVAAPDAVASFRGSEIDAIVLTNNVVVEYLNEAGDTITQMDSERLELGASSFHVPGRAVIEQEGLHIEGDVLTYDKPSDSFTFERNVLVEGLRFAIPDIAPSFDDPEAPPPIEMLPVLKTVTCDGRFSFRTSGDDGAPDTDDAGIALSGGLVTFQDNVVGTQGDTTLRSEYLEITLDSVTTIDETTGKENSNLGVTRVLAHGEPGNPAVLISPEATLSGEVLDLLNTADGPVVTLRGEPRILDATLAGENADGEATVFTAGARDRIKFRSRGAIGTEEGAPERIVLELENEAFLETAAASPEQDFRIEGDHVDLEFLKTVVAIEGEPAKKDFKLERLLATGAARGIFSGGLFTGDEIEALPRDSAAGKAEFEIMVTPNPRVELATEEPESGLRREIIIQSDRGKLTYTPASDSSEPTQAVFTGPTVLTVDEAGVITTELDAATSVTIELGAGDGSEDAGGSLSALVAVGDVHFRNQAQQVSGEGDQLRLIPLKDGQYRIRLSGEPATAKSEGSRSQEVTALNIDFDPAQNTLHATGEVIAQMAGLSLAGSQAAEAVAETAEAGTDEGGSGGILKCEDLTLSSDPDGGSTVVEAQGKVFFDDPDQGLFAKSDRLVYEEATALALLYGKDWTPASVTRQAQPEEGKAPRSVSVFGPLVILEQETGVLTCPDQGGVIVERPSPTGEEVETVKAKSSGPVRYIDNRLTLREDVVIGIEENGTETRALWCDLTTVFLNDTEGDPSAFDRILCEGRVHLEQTAPRKLVAEGQRLDWTFSEQDEELFLSGTDPQCWVVGLLGNTDFRDEADWFRFFQNTNEVQTENGRTVFIQQLTTES